MSLSLELAISIFALACSIYAVLQTRKNHRLSLVPNLDWHTDRLKSDNGVVFRFTLKNTGLGPAIILGWWFLLDGERYETKSRDPVPELVDVCLRGELPFELRQHGTPGVDSILPSGQEICIAELFMPGIKTSQELTFEKLSERVQFELRYQSLHGEFFNFSTAEN